MQESGTLEADALQFPESWISMAFPGPDVPSSDSEEYPMRTAVSFAGFSLSLSTSQRHL